MTSERELRHVVIDCLTEIAPDVDPDEIDPDVDLADQMGIDSMDVQGVVVAITEQTGIEIPEQTGIEIPERDYPKLRTLNEAAAYLAEVEHRVSGASARGVPWCARHHGNWAAGWRPDSRRPSVTDTHGVTLQ